MLCLQLFDENVKKARQLKNPVGLLFCEEMQDACFTWLRSRSLSVIYIVVEFDAHYSFYAEGFGACWSD
jgi:hypothetical protein